MSPAALPTSLVSDDAFLVVLQYPHFGCAHRMLDPLPTSRNEQHRSDVDETSDLRRAFERHFTPKEIAKLWHKDEDTIRRIFRDEPGVLCIPSTRGGVGKRSYVSLTIPESVVVSVHQRLETKDNGTKRSPNRAKRTRRATEFAAYEQNSRATNTSDAATLVDEQWEREVLRTARRLKNRVRDLSK
jgi:hypothetical protein